MEILVLSLVAGLVAVGGLWVASRNSKLTDFHDEIGVLANSVKLAADGASTAMDDAIEFVRESNFRIAAMEDAARQRTASIVHNGTVEIMNESFIAADGQTTVPSEIRKSIGAVAGTCLEWQVLSDSRLFVRVKNQSMADVNGNVAIPKERQSGTNKGQHDHGVFT